MKRVGTRVGVLMSGGVDSSVASALLQRRGFDVIGVTLQLWDYEKAAHRPPGERGCCDISHQIDARMVCHHLGIEHMVLDLRDSFVRHVVHPYENAYLSGRTPNPCIACNTHLKWGEVLRRMPVFGFDYIATGHYATVVRGREGVRLEKGRDRRKDQSYALWQLPRDALARTLLPLGRWTKADIRNIATELELRTADKPDSQEVCFIHGRYDDHLRESYPDRTKDLAEGEIVDVHGRVLGRHHGFYGFTIGQRRGLDIRDGQGPYYVTDLDAEANRVIVGGREDLRRPGLFAAGVNWVSYDAPRRPARVTVKIRYNDPVGRPATVLPEEDGRIAILFDTPMHAVTPGQSVVLYRGRAVWGGGLIRRAMRSDEAAELAATLPAYRRAG